MSPATRYAWRHYRRGMPGIAYVRAQIFSGHLASWQSLVGGVDHFRASPDLGLLDPLSLPYFVLPLWLAPAFVVLLTWIVAIGGRSFSYEGFR